MSDGISATCTKCDVALQVVDKEDDSSEVICPTCGTKFGNWGDVKTKMKEMLAGQFKDHPWITVS